jgi:hypothetical protein
MAICSVSEKIQTAYRRMAARPGFFRFPASHHFFSDLRVLNFLSSQFGPLEAQVSTKSAALCKGLEPGMCEL